jgi:hypothetical protein
MLLPSVTPLSVETYRARNIKNGIFSKFFDYGGLLLVYHFESSIVLDHRIN